MAKPESLINSSSFISIIIISLSKHYYQAVYT